MRHHLTFTLALMIPAVVSLNGCSETVGFLRLEVSAPTPDPPIICKQDPRHISRVHLELTCGNNTLVQTFTVSEKGGAISGIPLGTCHLEATAENSLGRAIFSGQKTLHIEAGDNPTISLELVPESCDATCDRDGDGIADADETALGLNPSATDTDGDGIDDGFELERCCSDPTLPDGKNCALGIQQVLPRLGAPNDTILIKTSTLVENADVHLGGQIFHQLFTDLTTTLLGRVDRNAVLGNVSVKVKDQPTAHWSDLYAVLRRPPELVVELDQEAGAKTARIAVVVDIATAGNVVYLLGASGPLGQTKLSFFPVILRYDLVTDKKQRLVIPVASVKPVAIAAQDGRVAIVGVKFSTSGSSSLILAHAKEIDDHLPLKVTQVPLKQVDATGILLEANARFAQVLTRDGLVRVDLDAAPTAPIQEPTPWPTLSPQTPGHPSTGNSKITCSGLAYRGEKSDTEGKAAYTYLACTSDCDPKAASPTSPPCRTQARLLRLGPIATCLRGGHAAASCWQSVPVTNPNDRALGSPVVDATRKQVYLLTSENGLFSAPFTPTASTPPLTRLHGFKLKLLATPPHPLALDATHGLLYLAAGARVRRFDLQGKSAPQSFFAGNIDQERAVMIAPTQDGGALSVLRTISGGAPTLLGVCVARCTGCPCPKAPAPPPGP